MCMCARTLLDIFTNWVAFEDFLFPSVEDEAFLNVGLSLKGMNLLLEE